MFYMGMIISISETELIYRAVFSGYTVLTITSCVILKVISV